MSDWELLQEYVNRRSESAFAELVRRHLSWVYSLALRQVGQRPLAEEVAQSVFVLLARKAASLRSGTLVGGWLFRTTFFIGSRARRAELRRQERELAASSMLTLSTLPEDNSAAWEHIAPHLDQGLDALSTTDRTAILLRFYENKPLLEVGRQLGISEEAAKKRVSRAVEKLRACLLQRGVAVGGAVLLVVLSQKTVEAAPTALAASVLKTAATIGVSGSATLLPQLARDTLKAWFWAKAKFSAAVAVGALVAGFLLLNSSSALRGRAAASTTSVSGTSSAVAPNPANLRTRETSVAPPLDNPLQTSHKAGALTGLVLDDQGHPVPGAKVWGGFNEHPFAEDTTDLAGQFALVRLAAPEFVTVTADGFAADQQKLDSTNAAGQLVFRLSPVLPFALRVVNESGQGVSGVCPFLYQWWGRPGTLGQYLPPVTDAEGRLRWLSAPKGEVELQLGKSGYRYSRTNKLSADGLEHLIVLHPVTTVTGSITDAETGAPVASFQLTGGHTQPWVPSDPVPMWDRESSPGSQGAYRLVIEEEQVPYLRIEAEGYETLEAELKLTNQLQSVCDFQLKRLSTTNSIRGTVWLPDDTPAAGVEVALCTADVGVMLSGTAFEPGAFGNLSSAQGVEYRRKTDEQGRFIFAPKPGAHTLAAVSSAGLGQVRCFDSSKPLEIRLQPWGRIEGNVRTRDGQWGGRTVHWTRPGNLTFWKTLFYRTKNFSAVSDPTGKFTLERVPPGDCRVQIDDDQNSAVIASELFRVNPDDTATVQLGGQGQAVTGKLVAPLGLEIRNWTNQDVTFAQLTVEWDSYHIPKELTGNAVERWKLEFEDTEAGRTWFRGQYSYGFKISADGSFLLPEVLPGKYRLFVNVGQGYFGQSSLAQASARITVPDTAADAGLPLDLGDITLIAMPH